LPSRPSFKEASFISVFPHKKHEWLVASFAASRSN